jgi:hypothetical protein
MAVMFAPICRNQNPTSNSTTGYRQEIGCPQLRQRPLSKIQLSTGMLSYQLIGLRQWRQREQGRTIDSCCGRREMQTFKKLPNNNPRTKPDNSKIKDVLTP